ncbi:MAG: family 10 glycosylhydrolase [Oscillatoriales cyanobacterium SM2_2_1]|nr:family 10 glycosylhydrolase [Oscillatoriales cyanobacterium SM2_2_1]
MAQIFDPIPSQETRSPEISTNQPIHTLELIAMRQELQDLIGRVENALTTAKIRQGQRDPLQLPAIAKARTVLKQLPQWVATRQYATARQQWEQTRQNLWRDYPPEAFVPVSEVRAIWLDRGTIVAAGSEERLAVVFDRLQAAGVNTVFLEVVNAGYPIYPSRIAPEQNPLIRRDWDPLASAVRLARARRMELHAWVWVFSVGNRRHNTLVGKPANYPGPVLERYPRWANRDQSGNIFAPEGKTFLDPSNPEVQNYLLSLYREIITQYDVDGIHLDYIRQPRHERGITLGYGTAARAQFAQKTGVDPLELTESDRSLWWMWTEFRTRAIDEFVATTAKQLRQLRPQLTISAAVFPWRYNERIQRLQQNWESWVSRGGY